MSATSNPFGFRPAFHPSGIDRDTLAYLLSGYGTQLNEGQPVLLSASGYVNIGGTTGDLYGIFMGCEYVDATGKPNVSCYWPAAQTVLSGTQPNAWVQADPATVYEVQADGSIPITSVGNQGNTTNLTNATSSGKSQCTFASAMSGAGVQAQWRVVGFGQALSNTPGDAYTIVQVQLASHQFVADKVAI